MGGERCRHGSLDAGTHGRGAATGPAQILMAVAVLGLVVAALAPLALHQASRARRARAFEEIARLAESVRAFQRDLRTFPDRSDGYPGILGYLLTDENAPEGLESWKGPRGLVVDHLVSNAPPGIAYRTRGRAAWRGPYLPGEATDPWGRAYVISVAGMRGDRPIRGWIVSAGPNGVLETDDGDGAIPPSSDDVGWRLR